MPGDSNGIERAVFCDQKVIVILDHIQRIIARMMYPPLNVILTNSGCCFPVCALYDLGYRFNTTSVEIKQGCRDVASDIHPAICHYHSNDVTKLGKGI